MLHADSIGQLSYLIPDLCNSIEWMDWRECTRSDECSAQCVRFYYERYTPFCESFTQRPLTCADYGHMHSTGINSCGKEYSETATSFLLNMTLLCGCQSKLFIQKPRLIISLELFSLDRYSRIWKPWAMPSNYNCLHERWQPAGGVWGDSDRSVRLSVRPGASCTGERDVLVYPSTQGWEPRWEKLRCCVQGEGDWLCGGGRGRYGIYAYRTPSRIGLMLNWKRKDVILFLWSKMHWFYLRLKRSVGICNHLSY